MAKQITIEQLQEEINNRNKWIEEYRIKILEYQKEMVNKNSKNIYKKFIDQAYKYINKYSEEIKTLEYQISVGCRKLKSITSISKELVNAGFKRGEFHASKMVRGWGNWTGEFNLKNNPTYIFIDWFGKSEERFEQFYKYLIDKYGSDVSKDNCKNIILMK